MIVVFQVWFLYEEFSQNCFDGLGFLTIDWFLVLNFGCTSVLKFYMGVWVLMFLLW